MQQTAPSPAIKKEFDPIAKTFHWLTSLAIVAQLGLGWTMADESLANGPLKLALFQWHKSIGIMILAITLLRLIWRFMNPPPPLPPMPAWQRWTALLSHWGFYALLIVMPLTGWAMISVSGFKTVLFGVIPLPNLPFLSDLPNKANIGEMLVNVHATLAFILAALLVLHINAALKHHFYDRDYVLLRMTPKFMQRALMKMRGEP